MVHKRGRPNAWDRGYDRRWQKAAAEYLWRNPHCLGCYAIGVTRKAIIVDHVIPHKGDQALFWDPRNWQPCCSWHHSSIKLELERRYFRKEIHANDLKLSGVVAEKLSREKYKPAIGLDGYAIAGS